LSGALQFLRGEQGGSGRKRPAFAERENNPAKWENFAIFLAKLRRKAYTPPLENSWFNQWI
jgi:hypothetical protein